MDFELEKNWQKVVAFLKADLGEKPDVQSIIFLIGVQELGKGYNDFKKDDKIALMHVAICRLLSSYGYYTLVGYDNDGWPHYECIKEIPFLENKEQEEFMRRAIVNYFLEENIIQP